MGFRDYESVARISRKDIEEGEMAIVFIDLSGGNIAGHDCAENTGTHEGDVIRLIRSRAMVWLGDSSPSSNCNARRKGVIAFSHSFDFFFNPRTVKTRISIVEIAALHRIR